MSISVYDQFISNELDPIEVLEINEEDKYSPEKLAAVLASLGDFKDKKYRRKISKEQVTKIHAVRFLLENTVKHQKRCAEGDASDTKRWKTGDENPEYSRVSLGLTFLSGETLDAEIEAAWTLVEMRRSLTETSSKSCEHSGTRRARTLRADRHETRKSGTLKKVASDLSSIAIENTQRPERRS